MTSPNTTWTEPGYPATVEFSLNTLERLRRRAVQGLMALPKRGLGLGGILLGQRDPATNVVQVEDFLEFACSHLAGPSFSLTPDERERAMKTIREKRVLAVVGWYFTRTQPPMAPRGTDLDLYESFCPSATQFMLMIRPGNTEPTKATLYFRDATGQVTQGIARDVAMWVASEDPALDASGYPGSGQGTPVAKAAAAAAAAAAKPFVTPDLPLGAHGFQPIRSYRLVSSKGATPGAPPEVVPQSLIPPEERVAPELPPLPEPLPEPEMLVPAKLPPPPPEKPALPDLPPAPEEAVIHENPVVVAKLVFKEKPPAPKKPAPAPVVEALAPGEPEPPVSDVPVMPERQRVKPAPVSPAPAPSRRKWLLIGSIAAAVISATALATSSLWLAPSLRVELSESGGHITAIWNGEMVRGEVHGKLEVTDSGQKYEVPLPPERLKAGVAGFDAKTGKISVVLKIGDQMATATWTAPENWAPPQR